MMRRVALFILVSVLAVQALFISAPEVSASGRPNYVSYFLGLGVDKTTHRNVLQNGVIGLQNQNKEQFISMIIGRYNYSAGNQYGSCTTSTSRSCDYAGARYIIQTMRGKVNGNWDYGWPDQSDINDWAAKIRSDDIGMRIGYEASWAGGVTTARFRFGSGGTRQYDIAKEAKAVGGQTVTFYSKSTGQIFYMLEVICANPVSANYTGLPDPINFALTPSISVTPTIAEAESGNVTVSPVVNNGGATKSSSAQWQVTTFKLDPDEGIPSSGSNATSPIAHYGNGAQVLKSGTQAFAKNTTSLSINPQAIPDEPVGTKLCYALSVQPRTQNDTRWNHSTPACVTISKKPKVQVLGGDLMVGRGSAYNPAATSNVDTSTSTKSGVSYGSWAEYAIVPTGTVSGMASGAAYTTGPTTVNLCTLSQLTFTSGSTNGSSCGATIGGYTQATIAPNVSARFPINVAAKNATPSVPASPKVLSSASVNLMGNNLSGSYQAPANVNTVTITGGSSIPKKRWIVINAPEATIRITGNITYTGDPLSSLDDIPQVVLIGKNIIVADSVTHIDAWLIAVGTDDSTTLPIVRGGVVNTCGAGGVTQESALTYEQCDKQLTVNGPVIANHLILRRTAGSGTGAESGDPAEIFNLRADAYIWATNYNLGLARVPTVSSQELPPRF